MTGVSGHVFVAKRKRGDAWYMKYRLPDGRQVQKKLGPAYTGKGRPPAGHFTRKLAEAELEAVKTYARDGSLAGLNASTGATFTDAATEYLRFVADVRQIDPVTVTDYRGVINGYLLAEFGAMELEAVTPDLIDTYKEKLIADGRLSNRTIVRHLTVLHGIFKRAKRVWKIAENPASADLVERPKVVYSGEFDTFDRDEIERLALAAENAQDSAIYKVAAFTGLRQGELLALRWSHVDFVDGLLHVRRNYTGGRDKMPKGKRVRSVPMTGDVLDALAKLKERGDFTRDDDLVFVSELGEYLDHYKLRKRYYGALDRAGLRRVRFHDLRHVFGSAAITKLDPYAVQSYMGHQHYSTTQRYLHHKPRREDAAALAEAFRVPNGVPNSANPSETQRNSDELNPHSQAKAA